MIFHPVKVPIKVISISHKFHLVCYDRIWVCRALWTLYLCLAKVSPPIDSLSWVRNKKRTFGHSEHLVAHLWTELSFLFLLHLAFVFGTLLEFTVVIFLKYYLRHLPAFQLSRDSSKVNSRAVSMTKRDSVFDVKSHVNAWLKVCKFWSECK